MKHVFIALSFAGMLVGCVTETKVISNGVPGSARVPTLPNGKTYGEPTVASTAEPISVATLLADPAVYAGKPVRVTGTISDVCAKKGCWVRLSLPEKKDNLFVKFTCPIDGRLIPIEAKGKPAVVEGTLVIDEITQDEARHYAKDGGATDAEIAAIVGTQKEITLESPAAIIAQ